MIHALLGAAAVMPLLQHWIDAAVILGGGVNAIVGLIQEGNAADALAAIRGMLSPQAVVIRADKRFVVDAVDPVPGDIVTCRPVTGHRPT